MKFKFLTLALLALLVGCKSETIGHSDESYGDGKINFGAAISKAQSRAADNNPMVNTGDLQTLGAFNVYGFATGSNAPLLDNALVEWKSPSWEMQNAPYWPKVSVDFYAYANWATAPSTINATGITATNVTIGQDELGANGQKDLMVAAAFDKLKEMRTELKFSHALSQIIFKAGNVDAAGLEVRIGGLRLVNINSVGEMKYLKATPAANSAIAWSSTTPTMYYVQGLQASTTAAFNAANIAAQDAITVDDMTNKPYSDYKQLQLPTATGNNALLLIPQTFTAWDPNVGAPQNTYIEILTVINAQGHRSDATKAGDKNFYYSGTPVQGVDGKSDTYGKIYIPIQSVANEVSAWTAGKSIKYIITFGDKNSGSGGGGYDENGDPVLVPIRFSAVVDAWTDVDVPLLTATFEATSSNVTGAFVDGFSTLFLSDVAAAKEVKTYSAKITVKGTLLDDVALTFGATQNHKIALNSTFEYNFSTLTTWTAGKTVSLTVPAGWEAKSYLNASTVVVNTVTAGNKITINGVSATRFVLTKIVAVP